MRKAYFSLILFVAGSMSAVAQDGLGLLDIYELALTNDPVIREAEANFFATAEVKR